MIAQVKVHFLAEMKRRFGEFSKLENSRSLFALGGGKVRVYVRYSKVHNKRTTFYGLRTDDLKKLDGHRSFICFLWDGQQEPLLLPYEEYAEIFRELQPAADGQFKTQVILGSKGVEVYVARAGRFDGESHFGWSALEDSVTGDGPRIPAFSHSQIQTLLGNIGEAKGYDIWIPYQDRSKIDRSLGGAWKCREQLPEGYGRIKAVMEEIDVIWIKKGANQLGALFEVEHTTSVYSGLLRFNDVHLAFPSVEPRFGIVANESRRSLFVRQLNRPSFQTSGLDKLCTFYEYSNIFVWHSRLKEKEDMGGVIR